MNRVNFPLELGAQGRLVADLHLALSEILESKAVLAGDQRSRQELRNELTDEISSGVFGPASQKLVSIFQEEHGLRPNGLVDEATADALNGALEGWRLLADSPSEAQNANPDDEYILHCQVLDSDNKPISGLRIEVFDQDPKSPHDPLGQPAVTDDEGLAAFRFLRSEFSEHPGERGPDLYFKVHQGAKLLTHSVNGKQGDQAVLRNFQQQRAPIVIQILGNQLNSAVRRVRGKQITAIVTLSPDLTPTPPSLLVIEVLSATPTPVLLHVVAADDRGQGRIELPEVMLSSLFGKDHPEFFFRVWHGTQMLADTEKSVRWHSLDAGKTLRIDATPTGRDQPSPHLVRGRVHASDLRSGWTVAAFDHPLRGDPVLLAKTEVADHGAYALTYSRSLLHPANKLLADLVLVVRDAAGKERYRSKVLRRAAPTFPLDVVLDEAAARGPSRFQRIAATVGPWIGELTPADLEPEEVDGLASSTGVGAGSLRSWVAAHRLVKELAESEAPIQISPEVALALRSSGATTARAVRSLQAADLRVRLKSASRASLVHLSEKEIAAAVKAFAGGFSRGPRRPARPITSAPEPRYGADLLDILTLGLDEHRATAFTDAWFHHKGDTSTFWEKLPTIPGFSEPATVDRAKLVLQLDTFARGNRELTQTLLTDDIKAVSDLVRYDTPDWERLLARAGVRGEINKTARAFAATVEIAFPHAFVAARLTDGPRPDEAPLAELLRTNSDFDLGKTVLRAWTAQRDLPGETVQTLARYARAFRLVRGPDRLGRMRTLLDRGLDSAPRIARIGKGAFLKHHAKALGGVASALPVYRRAVSATLVAQTLIFRYRKDLNALQPWAAGAGGHAALRKFETEANAYRFEREGGQLESDANWSVLFGNIDSCACEHCQSVLSPAAYLTDLLHFIVDPPTGSQHRGWYAKLRDRRPDIPHIFLNCNNTDTVLPYIDLVNEVLEAAVATASDRGAAHQTTRRAEDLALHPEHLNDKAYDKLTSANLRHPWTLPFDLAAEEIRAYLPLAGVTRSALMEVLGTPQPLPITRPTHAQPLELARHRQELARDRIAISPEALHIVLHPKGAEDWGLKEDDPMWSTPSSVRVASVREWMRRSQLGYEAFDQLLRCHSVNPPDKKGFRTQIALAKDNCDLSQANLTVSNGKRVLSSTQGINTKIRDTLTKIPPFVRLWRALGWSAYELDTVIQAIGFPGRILNGVSAAFINLVEVHRLRSELKLPIVELVTLWSRIPTDSPDPTKEISPYDRLFQDPGRGPVDQAFALNDARTDLKKTSLKLSDLLPVAASEGQTQGDLNGDLTSQHLGVVLGGIGVKAEDLARLIKHFFPDDAAPLNLANLSRLTGAATLARALKLSVAEFLALLNLTHINPFADPNRTRALVDEVKRARQSPLSVAQVDALLRRHVPAIEHNALGSAMRILRSCLQETAAELTPTADVDGSRLTELLMQSLPEPDPTQNQTDTPQDSQKLVQAIVDAIGLVGLDAETIKNWKKWFSDKPTTEPTTQEESDQKVAAGKKVDEWKENFEKAWNQLETLSIPGLPEMLDRVAFHYLIDPQRPDQHKKAKDLFGDPGWVPSTEDLTLVEHDKGTSRFDLLQGALLQCRRQILTPARLAEALALALNLAGDLVSSLITQHVLEDLEKRIPGMRTKLRPIIALFLAPEFATTADPPWPEGAADPIVDRFPSQANALRQLYAIAALLGALQPSVEELPLLFGTLRDPEWLNPQTLPTKETTDRAVLSDHYSAWRRLRDGWAVRAALGKTDGPFSTLLRSARQEVVDAKKQTVGRMPWDKTDDFESLIDTLVERLSWPRTDLEWLVGSSAFNASTAEVWADERWWTRLCEAMALVRRTGLPAQTLWELAQCSSESGPSEGEGFTLELIRQAGQRRRLADALKQAVRARYDETSWPVVARPVRDKLRMRQRDALTAWLLANKFQDFDSPDDLYRHYLIDVQMGACGETTRIREALSAVQLFVQQSMLGLIKGVEPDDTDRQAWEWMSRYRVWEANRKVFLWPEHWMEPELRDEKSPFFEDLEASILKDDVNEETVTRAYHEYLMKLQEVAQLEVRGSVREVEPEGATDPREMTVDRLHVIARTRSKPHRYFHRVREPGGDGGEWGPWRPIDVEIEGDHLLPVVWNRRLYLFWPVFTKKEQAPEKVRVPNQGETNHIPPKSKKWFEVQLAWTRLHNQAWAPKGLSTPVAVMKYNNRVERYILQSGITEDGRRYIVVYQPYNTDCSFLPKDSLISGLVVDSIRNRSSDSFLPLIWMVVAPESGVFEPQQRDGLDERSMFLSFSERSEGGRQVMLGIGKRPGLDRWSSAMSYLREANDNLELPSDLGQWVVRQPVLGSMTRPTTLLPLYRDRPSREVPNFPTLFLADDRRSFVIDPVEIHHVQVLGEATPTDRPMKEIEDEVFLGDAPFDKGDPVEEIEDEDLMDDTPFDKGDPVDERVLEAKQDGTLVLGGYVPFANAAERRTNLQMLRLGSQAVVSRSSLQHSRPVRLSDGIKHPSDATDGPSTVIFGEGQWSISWFERLWRFRPNYHPHVGLFVKHLNAYGLPGLLDPRPDFTAVDNQERDFLRRQNVNDYLLVNWEFQRTGRQGYSPSPLLVVAKDDEGKNAYPVEDIDFSEGGTYSLYNWELFFQNPLLVAVHLSRNQRFEEARQWFHFIFDPTDTPDSDEKTPQRYWKIKPLYQTYWAEDESAKGIDRLLYLFSEETSAAVKSAIYRDVEKQITKWLENPFKPWVIARLRWSAYQRTVVLKYIDNLMEWGDSCFRQYTLETVDQARLLYVLASDLLGPRPEVVETQDPKPVSFQDLYDSGQLDLFSDALVDVTAELNPTASTAWDDLPPVLSPTLYFCIPRDEKLLAYWDRVADRLYKIRHCLDIDGVARPLALFEPPIDPGQLVRAVAGGAGIAGALASLNAPIPAFRYSVMVARAKELTAEVRSFGSALLGALEKQDAETLGQLRSTHELALLDAVAAVRQLQVDEAVKSIVALEGTRSVTEKRRAHYQELIDAGISTLEARQISTMVEAGKLRVQAGGVQALASELSLIPQFDLGAEGFGGSPRVAAQFGGQQISTAIRIAADMMNVAAGAEDSTAATTGLKASYGRRAQEWELQRDLATLELSQIDLQLEAARLRQEIALREQSNHVLQRKNAGEADAFLRDKFTSGDLYGWMVGQLGSVYVQAYQLALDLARRAERAWQFEVAAAQPPQFIQSSHWDSLRKGLLAGDRLAMDLHRMEVAYLEQSRREYELTRNISLALVNSITLPNSSALEELKTTGSCHFTLEEKLFDQDRPGLYHRRIKTVSLTLPCVAGPYTPVHATLRLLKSYIRSSPEISDANDTNGDSYGSPTPEDSRFTYLPGPAQGIVTSRGQDDGGLFEMNLRDERYLPFEGHGVVGSTWKIELPPMQYQAFNYATIADAVLQLRYTAREGGERLRDAAIAAIDESNPTQP